MLKLAEQIKAWGRELGFQQIGITDVDLSQHEPRLKEWLAKHYHGEMHYMQRNTDLRLHPEKLLPGTIRVISARIDYLPAEKDTITVLRNKKKAYISRYALGRDYHKLIRKRLTTLAKKINQLAGDHGYRAFTDSAPVLERALAEKAGIGWISKSTNLINSKAGTWFFLGEVFTDLPLPVDPPQKTNHCGSCTACLDVCPTKAIVAPYVVNATRCISYLTIELRTSIPVELRPLIGNRIYGCDDCQLCCPWNKFAKTTQEADFKPRHNLANADLVELFLWDEQTFLKKTEGSAIRRIGFECWLRNIAVALGNAPYSEDIVAALKQRQNYPSDLVKEHVEWALNQLKP